jgi:hypothetical protein
VAQDDNAVLIPGTGSIWTGVVGTAVEPTLAQLATFVSAGTVPSGWTNLGHTSEDDLPTPGQDGGDTETKNSWQSKPLRTVITEKPTDFWDIKSLQILDPAVLGYYFGGGTPGAAASGRWIQPDNPAPLEKAVTIVMVDGTTPLAFFAPKMSLYRSDSLEVETGEFMTVPLRLTLLKAAGQPLGVWINTKLAP